MALSEPIWRVKRTPCPFYAKGHCVFAERCNFIHVVDEDETTLVEAEIEPEERMATAPKKFKYKVSAFRDAQAAPSARMSDLLRELKGVIGEEPRESNDNHDPLEILGPPGLASESKQWLEPEQPNTFPTTLSDSSDHDSHDSADRTPPMPVSQQDPVHDFHFPQSNLLSPVTLPDLQLRSFVRDYDDDDDARSDVSYATWATPGPLALSPPRSPALSSTFDLLSSPFGSPSSRIMSPHLASFLHRIHPISPQRSTYDNDGDFEPPDLSLDDLDSPDNYKNGSRTLQPTTHVLHDENGVLQPDTEDASGSTSRWDSLGQDTAVFVGGMSADEVELAMKRGRPTDFLDSSPEDFNASEALSSSPVDESFNDEDDGFLDSSPTAQLAYLDSANQDDTLNSFYDVYSDLEEDPPEADSRSDLESSDSEIPNAAPPPVMTPHTTMNRSVVFTPPPKSSRQSIHSSISSSHLPSHYRNWSSPFTAQNRSLDSPHLPASPSTSGRSQGSQDAPQTPPSNKVPFGFRKSLGESRNSTLLSDRKSRASVLSESPVDDVSPEANTISPMSSKAASRGLKPLRLSTILTSNSIASSSPSRSSFSSHPGSGNFTNSSDIVPSQFTSSNKALLSNLPHISEDNYNYPPHSATLEITDSTKRTSHRFSRLKTSMSAPLEPPRGAWTRSPSRSTSQPIMHEEDEQHGEDYTIRRPISIDTPISKASPKETLELPPRPLSRLVTTPKPALMFAIASDDVEQVRQVLASGEAGPNDPMGPQSALAFTLTNDQLSQKLDIVKVLLEYGADITSLQKELGSPNGEMKPILDKMDDATKYYLSQAETSLTRRAHVLMKRSSFKPLAKLRYGIVGQDRALEQLFRVLSMHNQKIATTPMVMLFCGPSGHGKSLLAQKFGSLLDVPTHTVNMTTLRSAHDLWQSYSISPDQSNSRAPCTLIEFLINNEGKRCIVVLDEIEKTKDDSVLWSLLLPWELGRCSFEANSMNIDVRNVVWLGTSNIGHDLVFEYHDSLKHPDSTMSRGEYVELMSRLRPRVSDRLGASVLSRVTTILPFVPFTREEMRVIASEALQTISSDVTSGLSKETLNSVIEGALGELIPSEGARSLYRAVSSLLVDAIDSV